MKKILRLFKIYVVIMKNSLDKDLFNFKFLWVLKFFRIFFPTLWFRNNMLSRGERIKKILSKNLGQYLLNWVKQSLQERLITYRYCRGTSQTTR